MSGTGAAGGRFKRAKKFDAWVLTYIGPLAVWLKESWLLALGGLLSTIGVILTQWLARDDTGALLTWATPVTVVLGSLAAVFVVVDKVADRRDKIDKEANEKTLEQLSEDLLKASEEVARNSVSDVNTVLEAAHDAAFMSGVAREVQVANVRKFMVISAVKAVGPGSRATYYVLTQTPNGRVLGDPIHAVGYGRDDRPDRPFIEEVDGDLNVWNMLDRADTEPQVVRRGDVVPGMDWSTKAYSAYVSLPVKAHGVVFGMLSVNTTNIDAIGGAQRASIIAMARVLALVEAFAMGVSALRARETS